MSGFSPPEIVCLLAERAQKKSFSAGQHIFVEGAVNVGLIIIDEGEALVDKLVCEEGQGLAHVQLAGWALVQREGTYARQATQYRTRPHSVPRLWSKLSAGQMAISWMHRNSFRA